MSTYSSILAGSPLLEFYFFVCVRFFAKFSILSSDYLDILITLILKSVSGLAQCLSWLEHHLNTLRLQV